MTRAYAHVDLLKPNSEDPDKMPHIATFYLGLHSLSEFDYYSKT